MRIKEINETATKKEEVEENLITRLIVFLSVPAIDTINNVYSELPL